MNDTSPKLFLRLPGQCGPKAEHSHRESKAAARHADEAGDSLEFEAHVISLEIEGEVCE